MFTEEQIKSMSPDELRVAIRQLQNQPSTENALVEVGSNLLQKHGVSGPVAVAIATASISGIFNLIQELVKLLK